MFIFLAASVLAQQEEIPVQGPYKHGDCVNITQGCANCSYVNITSITNPLGIRLVSQVTTTQLSSSEYYYPYCFPVNVFGEYIVRGRGDLDGINTPFGITIPITPTGDERQFSLMLILLLIGVALVVSGIQINNKYIGFIGGFLITISGVYTMIYGFNNVNDLYTKAAAIVMLGVGLYVAVISGYQLIEDSNS